MLEYPFENDESLRKFTLHRDINKSTRLYHKCFLCNDNIGSSKEKVTRARKLRVRTHYNQCIAVADIFGRLEEVHSKKQVLENHASFQLGPDCSFCAEKNFKDSDELLLHYLFCDPATEIIEESKRNSQEQAESQQSLRDGLEGVEIDHDAGHQSSSTNSSQSTDGSSVSKPSDPSDDEYAREESLNETRESIENMVKRMRKIKDKEFGEASAELSKAMLAIYNERKSEVPENSFNSNFAQHWFHIPHKMKIQALACVLPESFMFGVDRKTQNRFVKFFNNLSEPFKEPKHPQTMTVHHIEEALLLKEKQIYEIADEEADQHGKIMRGVTDEDISSVLQYLYFHSDEAPETDIFEFYEQRLRKKTSENFFRVFMSEENHKLYSVVQFEVASPEEADDNNDENNQPPLDEDAQNFAQREPEDEPIDDYAQNFAQREPEDEALDEDAQNFAHEEPEDERQNLAEDEPGAEAEEPGNAQNYSKPVKKKFRCDRRLAHNKFSLLCEEFNKERCRDGKPQISAFQFKQLIPPLFVEPKVKDEYSCLCAPCFSLRNTLSRVADLLFLLKITERNLSIEEVIVFLMEVKGCDDPLYPSLGVFDDACAKFSCSHGPNSKAEINVALSEKYKKIKDIMEDTSTDVLPKFYVKVMADLARKRDNERRILKNIAQTKTLSAKELLIEAAQRCKNDLFHHNETRHTGHLCTKLRRGIIHPPTALICECDFSGEYSAGKTGGTVTQNNALRGNNDELVIHCFTIWGYFMLDGKLTRRRFNSCLMYWKDDSNAYSKKGGHIVKLHFQKCLKYIEDNEVFEGYERAILMSDQAVDYRSWKVLSDVSDEDGWGLPVCKVFKQSRHGKSTIDGVGGHAKTMMKRDELNGKCIPAIGLGDYLPSLGERLTANMVDPNGIFHCFAHIPLPTDLRIMMVHDNLFMNMGKLSKKGSDGSKIITGQRSIRMIKAKVEEKRSGSYYLYNISNTVCPDLCDSCLFSAADFCSKCVSYEISGNQAEFHPLE
ncbi:Oidioi.mRNA.OKI2018_I69.XSR.g15965.t1.cds [Oikopleura dioica]|uniref:Oidioi.mRNA.OKI2018_I69.XSR.g15965.t1.cds n=1 Tax=Oikopleura dioica TaxID=34765 RepID=A0ABN7SF31_OIKDI|nr:Oidioi.mRNA.OKI2018_I69.XSR.g15965.t1.cds [Oikopleura dioica]